MMMDDAMRTKNNTIELGLRLGGKLRRRLVRASHKKFRVRAAAAHPMPTGRKNLFDREATVLGAGL